MDQAQLLSLIGGIYDKLVADVADRVQQQLNDDSLRSDWIDARIESWVENNLDLEDAAKEAVRNSDHLADFITETVKNNLTFSISVD